MPSVAAHAFISTSHGHKSYDCNLQANSAFRTTEAFLLSNCTFVLRNFMAIVALNKCQKHSSLTWNVHRSILRRVESGSIVLYNVQLVLSIYSTNLASRT
jgi:hypothetical protein